MYIYMYTCMSAHVYALYPYIGAVLIREVVKYTTWFGRS